jgi:ribosomal protein S18 acetylase RimI-like enzyme
MGSGLDRVVGNGSARVNGRIRVGPWHGDERVGYLAPVGDGPAPGVTDVRSACDRLARGGYAEVVTAAIGPLEAQGFLLAGFEVHEKLHLLERDLHGLPEAPPATLRRARRRDRARVLAVDAAAFSDFWRLDDAGLDEALSATPASRFRVALTATEAGPGGVDAIGGYAVFGRAGRRGFLQRLAVDPAAQGAGLGRALVLDGLGWLRRRGVERVVVNTQEANQRALRLYEQLGFRRQAGGLAVLKKSL